jgi:hypothetical protein
MEVSDMANMELNKNMVSNNDLEHVTGGIDQATQQKLAEKIKKNGVIMAAPQNTSVENGKLFACEDHTGDNTGKI